MRVAESISSGNFAFITSIRDRRFPVVDAELGVVFCIVVFDLPCNMEAVEVAGAGRVELPPVLQKPSSAIVGEAFKVRDGKIPHVEAVLEGLPFGAKSGWLIA